MDALCLSLLVFVTVIYKLSADYRILWYKYLLWNLYNDTVK